MNNYIDLLFLALLLRTLINIVLIVTQNKGGNLIKALDLCDYKPYSVWYQVIKYHKISSSYNKMRL